MRAVRTGAALALMVAALTPAPAAAQKPSTTTRPGGGPPTSTTTTTTTTSSSTTSSSTTTSQETTTTVAELGAGLSGGVAISAPTSSNLGSASTESGHISAKLGTVTVTGSGSGLIAPSFTATVSASSFVTGSGSSHETIPPGSVRYWSGPATAVSGLLGTGSPGQTTAAEAVDLAAARTAFAGSGSALSISVSWNPTVTVNIPSSAVAGVYTGTITHSAA